MRKYDDEFKRNVVRKVFDGQSVSRISREIGVNESLIDKWKRAALDNGDGIKTGAELAETQALKWRIREWTSGSLPKSFRRETFRTAAHSLESSAGFNYDALTQSVKKAVFFDTLRI